MLRKFTLVATLISSVSLVMAQDESLAISGSVDTYYKYDFAKVANISTSFASDQNSVSLGMLDLALKKTTGKASFVGEVSFGPRGQDQSIINAGGSGNSFHIQNLNATYAFSDKFSMTAGFMATFCGFEVISPVGNYNYSTSYLFTNGPFQHAGIKGTYSFSDKASLMVGLFNDWNVYQDFNGVSDFGAQLFVSPAKGWNAYLNTVIGSPSGTMFDLTTSYQVSDAFKIGLNADGYSKNNDAGGFTGAALYLQNSFTSGFGLGVRAEYFTSEKGTDATTYSGVTPGESVVSFTLSGNLKAGGLTFIPELRLDNGSTAQFLNSNNAATKSATQFSLAAVYAF